MDINELTPLDEVLREYGRRLARYRKSQGYSQARLAEEAGLGIATLKRIEAGNDSQMESWLKLLRALGMSAEINTFLPEKRVSPMEEVKAGRRKRRRADKSSVRWGDEQL